MDSCAPPAVVLAAARAQVGVLEDRLMTGISDAELVDGVAEVRAVKGQLAALEARLLAEADVRDLARKQLHWGSTTDWFTHLAGLTRREGRRAVAHASQLVAERTATLDALRRAEVSPAQAGIICDAVDTLPSRPALRARGEQTLLEEARRLNATELARTARHLADVIDPTAPSAVTKPPWPGRSGPPTPAASSPSPTTALAGSASRAGAAWRAAPSCAPHSFPSPSPRRPSTRTPPGARSRPIPETTAPACSTRWSSWRSTPSTPTGHPPPTEPDPGLRSPWTSSPSAPASATTSAPKPSPTTASGSRSQPSDAWPATPI